VDIINMKAAAYDALAQIEALRARQRNRGRYNG